MPEGQPDPGPLEVDAHLAVAGGKMAIESASITGKAAEASASGSVDGTGEIVRFDAKLDVAKLDLNAYLPPPSEADAAEAVPAEASGWRPTGAAGSPGRSGPDPDTQPTARAARATVAHSRCGQAFEEAVPVDREGMVKRIQRGYGDRSR